MIPLSNRVNSLIELDPGVVAPASLPDRLYAVLMYRILTCAMKPGERVTEKGICAEMSVSRGNPKPTKSTSARTVVFTRRWCDARATRSSKQWSRLHWTAISGRSIWDSMWARRDAATSEHHQLVGALERRDAERARSLMKEHVSRAEERIVAALRAAGYR